MQSQESANVEKVPNSIVQQENFHQIYIDSDNCVEEIVIDDSEDDRAPCLDENSINDASSNKVKNLYLSATSLPVAQYQIPAIEILIGRMK